MISWYRIVRLPARCFDSRDFSFHIIARWQARCTCALDVDESSIADNLMD